MSGKGTPDTHRSRLLAEEKQEKAWALRVKGYTLVEIAAEVGYSGAQGAHTAIQSYRQKRIQASVDSAEERDRDLDLLEQMRKRLALAATRTNEDGTPAPIDYEAFRGIMLVLDRRARIFGYDAKDQRDDRQAEALALLAQTLADLLDAVLVRLGLSEELRMQGREELSRGLRELDAG